MKKFFFTIAAALCFASLCYASKRETKSVCDHPFVAIPGLENCFYINSTDSHVWVLAKEACSRLEATLAGSETEQKTKIVADYILKNHKSDTHQYWIGLHDYFRRDIFVALRNGLLQSEPQQSMLKKESADRNIENRCVVIEANKQQLTPDECTEYHNYVCETLPPCPLLKPKCTDLEGFELVPNVGCLHFHVSTINTWIDARDDCARKNGQLLEMETKEKFDKMRNYALKYIPSGTNFFIAIYDAHHKGKWVWEQLGVETTYNGFGNGEPSNRTAHIFAYMNSKLDYYWSDSTWDKEYNYICEIPNRCLQE